MDCSLLYVSRRLASLDEIAAIVGVSRTRNAALNVTGALVASRSRFAQVLEGPDATVDELIASIYRDRRHTDVQVLVHEKIVKREFENWALAYGGTSYFVDGLIEVLANRAGAAPEPYHLQRLIQAMAEFTRSLH